MSIMYLECRLDCRLVSWKLRSIENKRRLSRCYISRASRKQLYANFCWHSAGGHRDKALHDDPDESFAVFYYWLPIKYHWRQAVCRTDFRQINFCPKILTICFLFVKETFDNVLSDEINHVSPMFIYEHKSMQINMGRKMNVCISVLL